VGIIGVYFFGDVTDAGSVALANAMTDNSMPLELVRLQ
jgi:hypothetical protein